MSNRSTGTPLWEIRWQGGSILFAGSLEEMGEEINRRHRETGLQHAAREVRFTSGKMKDRGTVWMNRNLFDT